MNIKQIKNNYQYKYRFIDINKLGEIYGYIYNVNDEQYFINDKETYFKIIDSVQFVLYLVSPKEPLNLCLRAFFISIIYLHIFFN